MQKKSARKRGQGAPRQARAPIDWNEARRLFEVERLSLTEIGKRIGCRREAVSQHRKRDGWDRTETARSAHVRAVEKIAERIAVETGDRQVAAVQEELDIDAERRRQHRELLFINGKYLAGMRKLVAPEDAAAQAPVLLFGEGGSPDLTLRRLMLNIATRVNGDGAGPGAGDGGEDSGAEEAAVCSAMGELAQDEPKGV